MALTSTSGTQAVTQSAWRQLEVTQAKQFAERAAQAARALQTKASDAERAASRAQENARTLRVEADQAQGVAAQAGLEVRSYDSSSQIGPQVLTKVDQAVQAQKTTSAEMQPSPTVNSQGETIGTVINVTA